MEGIYFIENTIDERRSRISCYCKTEKEAREAIKECSDWFRQKGTGIIWYQEFGLGKTPKKIYANPDW